MGDSLTTIVAIFLAAILMFVFPLLSISDRSDDIAQLGVQTATVDFVDNIRSTGVITEENYNAFLNTLAATGNSYDVDMEVKVLDENPGKKAAWAVENKIGENIYYSVYDSQIQATLLSTESGKSGRYKLKEGDIVSVSVKNTNVTISQMLRNFFYTISGNDTYQVAAKHSGMVMSNGT